MSSPFDPYHEWLGIPPKDQPPNHYRLLGVELFEEQPNVIEHAADQRMALLKNFQAGKHSAMSQKLLNEVAAARVCLLKPEKKAAYDAKLRAELPSQPERSDDSLDSGLKEAIQQAQTRKVAAATDAALKPPQDHRVFIGVGAGVVVLLLGLVVWLAMSGGKPEVAVKQEGSSQPSAVSSQAEADAGQKPSPKREQPAVSGQPSGGSSSPHEDLSPKT